MQGPKKMRLTRRTALFMVAHQILADPDFIRIHEIKHFAHFFLVAAFILIGH